MELEVILSVKRFVIAHRLPRYSVLIVEVQGIDLILRNVDHKSINLEQCQSYEESSNNRTHHFVRFNCITLRVY